MSVFDRLDNRTVLQLRAMLYQMTGKRVSTSMRKPALIKALKKAGYKETKINTAKANKFCSGLTVAELRKRATELGIKGRSKMNKAELCVHVSLGY